MSRVASLAASLAGGWIEIDPVDGFQRTWLEALRESERSGLLETLYLKHLEERAAFLYRHRSAVAVTELLNEAEIAAVEDSASPHRFATLLSLRADARRLLGDLGGALEDLERALLVADERSKSSVHMIELAIEIDLGRLDRARTSLDEILLYGRGAEATSQLALNAKIASIRWFNAAGMYSAAADEARRTIAALEKVPNPTIAQRNTKRSLRVSGALARAMSASEPKEVSAALVELSNLASEGAIDAASKVALRLERAELLTRRRETTDVLDAQTEVERALSTIEEHLAASVLLRARSLAQLHAIARRLDDGSREREVGNALEASFGPLVEAWKAIELQEGGVGFLDFAARREVLSEVIESRLHVGVEHAFAAVLRVDACGTLARRLSHFSEGPLRELNVADVQRIGARHGVRIVYLIPAESRTHRFTVEDGSVAYRRLDGRRSMDRDVRAIRVHVRKRPTDPPAEASRSFTEATRTLYEQLFDGRTPLPEAGVWLVSIDDLGPAPLVARSDEMDTPVGLSVPVTVLPSLHAAVRVGRVRTGERPGRPRLGVYSLKGARQGRVEIGLTETEVLAFRRAAFTLDWIGHEAATVDGFVSTLTGGADMFVAWTHGFLNHSSSRPARLVLSDGDASRVEHIDSEFIENKLAEKPVRDAPRVAFVASCRVGQGQERAGDGAASDLSGAFLGQGVPAVVVSNADLDRDATFVLMESFVTSFLEDADTAGRAMLDARRAVAAREGFEHPHFWALPKLVGWSPIRARRE